ALAAELVDLSVDVLVAPLSAVWPARDATTTIPIVMVFPGDPVAYGLVPSLAKPGGNVTGVSFCAGQLNEKRLDLLKQTLPNLSRVAVLFDTSIPAPALSVQQLQGTAELLSVRLQPLGVGQLGDLAPTFEAAAAELADAVLLGAGDSLVRLIEPIVALA